MRFNKKTALSPNRVDTRTFWRVQTVYSGTSMIMVLVIRLKSPIEMKLA